MDYEKKKEALAIVKQMVEDGEIAQDVAEKYFPELKESEDEKIRKDLILFFIERAKYTEDSTFNGLSSKEIIAWLEKQKHDGKKWIYEDVYLKEKEQLIQDGIDEVLENPQKYGLEKQGEQKFIDKIQIGKKYKCIASPRYSTFMKGCIYQPEDKFLCSLMNFCSDCFEPVEEVELNPAEKVEPKFKVGDWVTNSFETVQITGYDIDYGYQVNYKGNLQHRDTDIIEKEYHLWTIQDAKDGDVLCYKDEISLYKHDIKNCTKQETTFGGFVYYCCYDGKRFITDSLYSITEQDKTNIHPATEEQRDLLFQKMHEAGFEWDADKKELKKIEQKPAWSEEDERIIKLIESATWDGEKLNQGEAGIIHNWLKFLKERVQPQPTHWKPSEQEKVALRTAIYIMTKERSFPKLGEHLQNILDVFEGQFREEWKPIEEQIKEGLEEAASDWGIKASVSPISMIIDSGKPIGTQKHTISHQDSFKKGAEWVINKLKTLM